VGGRLFITRIVLALITILLLVVAVNSYADKDLILTQIEMSAVHSGFDRVFGDPLAPSPGIVFGEKGSGKSGLRLSIQRSVAAYNEQHPTARVLEAEYSEFDGFLESFRQATGLPADTHRSAPELVARFGLADHLDAILSVAVTTLVDGMLSGGKRPKKLSKKRKLDLLLITATYYSSKHRSPRAKAAPTWQTPCAPRRSIRLCAGQACHLP